jgi:hypothetical protein
VLRRHYLAGRKAHALEGGGGGGAPPRRPAVSDLLQSATFSSYTLVADAGLAALAGAAPPSSPETSLAATRWQTWGWPTWLALKRAEFTYCVSLAERVEGPQSVDFSYRKGYRRGAGLPPRRQRLFLRKSDRRGVAVPA